MRPRRAKSAATRSAVARSTSSRPSAVISHRIARPSSGCGVRVHQTGRLQPADDRGHRGRVHLQALAHLAQRQRTAPGEGQQHQRLEPREGQAVLACRISSSSPMTICWARISDVTARICSTAPQRRPHCRDASSIGSNGNGLLPRHEPQALTVGRAVPGNCRRLVASSVHVSAARTRRLLSGPPPGRLRPPRRGRRLGLSAAVPSCPGWTVESVCGMSRPSTCTRSRCSASAPCRSRGRRTSTTATPSSCTTKPGPRSSAALREAGTELPTWTFTPTTDLGLLVPPDGPRDGRPPRSTSSSRTTSSRRSTADLALDGIDEVLFPIARRSVVGRGRHRSTRSTRRCGSPPRAGPGPFRPTRRRSP